VQVETVKEWEWVDIIAGKSGDPIHLVRFVYAWFEFTFAKGYIIRSPLPSSTDKMWSVN
jgi:hypothetical protein